MQSNTTVICWIAFWWTLLVGCSSDEITDEPTDTGAHSEAGTDGDAESDADGESDFDGDAESNSESDSDEDEETDGDSNSDAELDMDGDSESDGDAESEMNEDSDGDSESDGDAESEMDGDSDADGDANADTDRDDDIDSVTGADTSVDGNGMCQYSCQLQCDSGVEMPGTCQRPNQICCNTGSDGDNDSDVEEDLDTVADTNTHADTDTDMDTDGVSDTDSVADDSHRSNGCDSTTAPVDDGVIEVNGENATYLLHVPDGYDSSRAYPLMFSFHGAGVEPSMFITYFNMPTVVGEEAIVVTPSCVGEAAAWNESRDLPLVDALLEKMLAAYCIDTSRIFAGGHSSGGFFSHAVGCTRGDVFRGIAPISAGPPNGSCIGEVAVWIAHGNADDVVSVDMGRAARDFWAESNGCDVSSFEEVSPSPTVAYDGCDAGLPVRYCEYDGDHYLPSYAPQGIWDFFKTL